MNCPDTWTIPLQNTGGLSACQLVRDESAPPPVHHHSGCRSQQQRACRVLLPRSARSFITYGNLVITLNHPKTLFLWSVFRHPWGCCGIIFSSVISFKQFFPFNDILETGLQNNKSSRPQINFLDVFTIRPFVSLPFHRVGKHKLDLRNQLFPRSWPNFHHKPTCNWKSEMPFLSSAERQIWPNAGNFWH